MQDLAAILLAYLLIGYGSSLATYLILRRTAHRNIACRPIIQIPSWNISCWLLTVGLFSGATEWIIAIASLFADLVSSLNPLLIPQDECCRAALDWQTSRVWLVEGACAAFCIIIATTHAEVKRTESPPERVYPLLLLTCSHCLLVASCSAFAFAAITRYTYLEPPLGSSHWSGWSVHGGVGRGIEPLLERNGLEDRRATSCCRPFRARFLGPY